ncbi:Bbp16 family capsid cement protein [uncultured Paraglaciecola sp.]|uniref:Bbp16 family capsid cement protein n=1 Tax=uncultured Paraglaciecola sp. TaxID=1765024 RepID=UPI00261305A7|nr:hypothetical protein [uncultured Paraglaciecola sp.]
MIFDKTLQFSDAQAITATAVSTNVIDLGANDAPHGETAGPARDIAVGMEIPLAVQVVETFLTLTSLAIVLQASAAENMSSPTEITIADIAVADLVAGKTLPYPTFPEGVSGRYMRLNYVVTGSDATAGKITAGVVAAANSR